MKETVASVALSQPTVRCVDCRSSEAYQEGAKFFFSERCFSVGQVAPEIF